MTGQAFFNAVANGRVDILGLLLNLLRTTSAADAGGGDRRCPAIDYCAIGGLAVNAYVEPVVSLDLDIVVVASMVTPLCRAAAAAGFAIERFPHSINLSASGSDLRVQIQTDPRYQDFIARAQTRTVLGYEIRVASLDDILQGKVWAYSDPARRRSKRQKDLADLARIVEAYPALAERLPAVVKKRME